MVERQPDGILEFEETAGYAAAIPEGTVRRYAAIQARIDATR
jgi:hypothetical protein